MNVLKTLWSSIEGDPVLMKKLHGWLTVVWFIVSIPICVWAFFDPDNKWLISILIFVSFYANTAGHWSSWQASKVEVRQDEIEQAHQDKEDN